MNGHLDMVVWLYENVKEICISYVIDLAAMNEHLDVIKWISKRTNDGCTMNAMNHAITNNHLDVVVWLNENRTEESIKYAAKIAEKKLLYRNWVLSS